MADPVVSSKFGQRPLLEVPALEVFNTNAAIGSLQHDRPKAHPVFGRSGYTAPVPDYASQRMEAFGNPPFPYPNVVGGYAPPVQSYFNIGQNVPRNAYSAPAPAPAPVQYGMSPNYAPGHYYYGPTGSLGGLPRPTYYNPFPGVENPYFRVPPPPLPPPPPQVYHHPTDENFVIEGVLEFGLLTTVNLKRTSGTFRALPEFLKRELERTYGKYAHTDIKITAEQGEYHIYAQPRGGFIQTDRGPPHAFSHNDNPHNSSYRPRSNENWQEWNPHQRHSYRDYEYDDRY